MTTQRPARHHRRLPARQARQEDRGARSRKSAQLRFRAGARRGGGPPAARPRPPTRTAHRRPATASAVRDRQRDAAAVRVRRGVERDASAVGDDVRQRPRRAERPASGPRPARRRARPPSRRDAATPAPARRHPAPSRPTPATDWITAKLAAAVRGRSTAPTPAEPPGQRRRGRPGQAARRLRARRHGEVHPRPGRGHRQRRQERDRRARGQQPGPDRHQRDEVDLNFTARAPRSSPTSPTRLAGARRATANQFGIVLDGRVDLGAEHERADHRRQRARSPAASRSRPRADPGRPAQVRCAAAVVRGADRAAISATLGTDAAAQRPARRPHRPRRSSSSTRCSSTGPSGS